jgi:YbbR domain-containing protein
MAYHPFRHLGLKFLSIALAVAIWLIVGDQRSVERSVRVPLEFHNVPDGLELVANPPDSVEVRLRGPSSALGRLLPGEVVAVLDLQSARAGTRLFHLLADEVRVPYGVQVSQVNPSSMTLAFEQSMTKTVPVLPAVDGDPAEGFRVGRISAAPAVVAVVGPRSHVVDLKSATTEPVIVTRATTAVVDRVTVGVTDELVRLVTPQTATVTVEILASEVEKRLTAVKVIPRNLPAGRSARITPATVDIVVRGPMSVLEALTSLGVFVELAGLAPGRFELPVHIDPAANVEVERAEPSTVEVRIR